MGYGELYEIRLDSVEDSDWAPEHTRPAWRTARRRLPMGRDLVFRALGEERDFKVELFLELTQVWTHDAEITGAKAGNAEPDDRSYWGTGMLSQCKKGTNDCELYADIKRASVTFFEMFGKHVFHALMRTDEEEFNVDPRYFIEKEKFINGRKFPQAGSALSNLEAEMYMFCTSDFYEILTDRAGVVTWNPKRRLLQQIDYWGNCYPGQNQATRVYRISMGMLIDDGFFAVAGGTEATVQNYVIGMMNDINTMYVGQMSVEIGLRNLVLGDIEGFNAQTFNEAPTNPGSKTCPSGMDPSTRLTQLRIWRGTYAAQTNGLWHLMTHCHPAPGTVGVAYVGALCQSYGVGVNSWLGASRSWTVVAHEAGHNFGSGHTFNKVVNGQQAVGGIMDYGDGLLNGVYQFHPTHKQEVCSEISNSMTQARAIPACWQALNTEVTPTPPTPTPDPTPAPVDPTPDPTQAPIPTPQPTTAVVNAPSSPVPGEDRFYKWEVRSNRWSECSSSCGPGIRTQVVQCREVNLAACPSWYTYTAADIATCSTARLELYCQSTVVEDTLCSAGCRPNAATRTCGTNTSERCPNDLCNNGNLDSGEMCDPGIDSCCANNCQSWKTTAECLNTNPTVDAAVMDYSQRLYMFQGNQMAAWNDWDVDRMAPGFPMPLTAIRGLDANFLNGIDSAASFYDDLVFLFKGLEFVMVDLGEMARTSTVRDAVSYFALNQEMIDCGKIDAIVSFYWTLEFICEGIVSEFRWNVATFEAEVVNQKWRDLNHEFPVAYAGADVGAACRNPATGDIRFFKGNQYVSWAPNGDASAGINPRWPGASAGFATETCLVENCSSCDNATCKKCKSGYSRKNKGASCQHKSTFLSITFDEDNSYSAMAAEFMNGGEGGSVDNGGFDTGVVTPNGLFGNGGELDGQTAVKLQDVDFGSVVETWRVSFWWKPTQLRNERFLTITNGKESSCGSPGCNQFIINFVHTSTKGTEPITGPTFAIELFMFGEFLDCYIDNGEIGADQPDTTRAIKVNEWNKISIEFDTGRVITTANGLKHEVEKAQDGIGASNVGVQFKDWEIGALENGLSGTIDKFEVANLVPGAVPKHSRPMWFKVTIGGLVAIFVLFVAFIAYKIKTRNKGIPSGVSSANL